MYISKIEIQNFRNFDENSEPIEFNEKINIIIGHNNAGKTNLLKALGLIFDNTISKRLTIDDFNKKIDISQYFELNPEEILKKPSPPKIKVSVFISESDSSKNELDDDNDVVFNWRTEIEPKYEAKLTYEFFLPEGAALNQYQNKIHEMIKKENTSEENYWRMIKKQFIHKYIYRIYAGDEKLKNNVRQIFITTHSTHITSSVELDELIILNEKNNKLNVAYPKIILKNYEKSKNYLTRFLDATKSDMLFAKSVIFVEGIAEQLLLEVFADYLSDKYNLKDNHISIVNVNGRYFEHFLKLFDYDNTDENKIYCINKRVACITDVDPVKKEKGKTQWEKCFPFELNVNTDNYEYKQFSGILDKLIHDYNQNNKCLNIKVFSQNIGKGKTFEYEIAYNNPNCKLLITDSSSNQNELEKLMDAYSENKSIDEILEEFKDNKTKTKYKNFLENNITSWSEDEKKRTLIATRYLESIENNSGKGEYALELNYELRTNLEKRKADDYIKFKIPKYIEDALKWVCNND